MKKLLALLAVVALFPSCAAGQVSQVKPYLGTAEEVLAELLCSEVNAEKAGLTLGQARDAYCSTRDLWLPFLEKATEVKAGKSTLDAARYSFTAPASSGSAAPAAPAAAGAPAK